MKRNTWLGLVGIFGVWLTAGLALPFVNVLNMFTPQQLMVVRGFVTALMALIGLRGAIGRVDRFTVLIAATLPLATLGLFQGIRHWGAGPTMVIITATPLVNFAIASLSGKKVSQTSVIALVIMLTGVCLARWGGEFQWEGFCWIVFGTAMNGILYEWFARAKATSLQKCFWACTAMGTLGLVLNWDTPWVPITEPGLIIRLLGFAFVGGFLYWIANLVAFENLSTAEGSVLVQGETPVVILGATLLLGERFTLIQWTGVIVSLCGAGYLSWWLQQQQKTAAVPATS